MSPFSFDSDIEDRVDRWGCFGSLILILAGIGLAVYGVGLVHASESNGWGWFCIALGVILLFLGGGWEFFLWGIWP
jgi:hypothetical protein